MYMIPVDIKAFADFKIDLITNFDCKPLPQVLFFVVIDQKFTTLLFAEEILLCTDQRVRHP